MSDKLADLLREAVIEMRNLSINLDLIYDKVYTRSQFGYSAMSGAICEADRVRAKIEEELEKYDKAKDLSPTELVATWPAWRRKLYGGCEVPKKEE